MRKLMRPRLIAIACCIALLALLTSPVAEPGVRFTPGEGTFTIGEGRLVFTIGHVGHAAAADYVADGVDDHIQFQQALDALPTGGGKLIVLAGTYNFGAAVSRAIDNVTIQGIGHATVINRDGINPVFTAGAQSNWVFRDFKTDAGGIELTAATAYTLQNITIGASYIAFRTDVAAEAWDIPTGRTATLVVAASNSSPQSKAQADFIADGIDDQETIQTAIDALPPGGGKVVLMEGTFHVRPGHPTAHDAALLLRSNVTLEGVSRAAILRMKDGIGGPVTIVRSSAGAVGIQVRNFTINANLTKAGPDAYFVGLYLTAPKFFTITGMHFIDGTSAFGVNGAISGNIINNHVQDIVADGISVDMSRLILVQGNIVENALGGIDLNVTDDSSVIGNIVYNTGLVRAGIGIDMHSAVPGVPPGSTFNLIQGNIFDNLIAGMSIRSGSIHNTFIDNVIRNTGNGFLIDSPHNKMSGNTIENVSNGFWIRGTSDFTEISGNYIINTSGSGVFIQGVNDCIIVGNTFFSSGLGSVQVHGVSERTIIKNNVFNHDPLIGVPATGIVITATALDTFIKNNHLAFAAITPISDAGITTIIKGNPGHVTENTGTAMFSGTGAATTFTIAHGMAGDLIPTVVDLEAKSADAAGAKHWSADATNITITFITAPPAGTNNIVISWEAKVR